MTPTYFTISNFCISDTAIPQEVADKIYQHHLLPLDHVRDKLGNPVYISRNSGYRPYRWERNKGRSGDSEHVFRDLGAVDVRANNMDELIYCLKTYSDYNRICLYTQHGFVHCDYASEDGQRHYYEAGEDKEWVWKGVIDAGVA